MKSATLDPGTGLYFANPSEKGSEPAPASPAAAAPANEGFNGPAGPDSDANIVLADYLALPVSERIRFFLMWDESEEGFQKEDIQRLNDVVERAGVSVMDRGAVERAVKDEWNGSRAVRKGTRGPANSAAKGTIKGKVRR